MNNQDDFEYEDKDSYLADNNYEEKASWNDSYNPVRSTSQYLRNSWYDGFTDSTKEEDATDEGLHKVLKELNNTINLTNNSIDGSEKSLVVKYSDGKRNNNITNNELFVSPNFLITEDFKLIEKDFKYYDILDGMNGQALMCSFMKKNIYKNEANQYSASDKWAIRNIYMTDLQSTASSEVYLKWPGFMNYISQQMILYGTNKNDITQNILKSLELNSLKFDDIIETLCYNRLSKTKIDFEIFPEEMRKKMREADIIFNDSLNSSDGNLGLNIAPIDKFTRASKIYKDLLDIFDPDEDEIKSNPKTYIIPSDSKLDRPFTGTNVYNENSKVDGNIIHASLDHNQKIREKIKNIADCLQSKNLKDDLILTEETYKLIIPPVNNEDVLKYQSIKEENKNAINNIKSAFMFKNNINSLYCYGTTTGDIDENSLYKIHFNETERLYQSKELLASKKYHITIAIDQSGSMHNNIKEARKLGIIISEALTSLRDIKFSVYGFNTTNVNTIVYKDAKYKKIEALSQARADGATALGFHIAAIADKIHLQYGNVDNKIMFVITDGRPTHGSAKLNGIKHTARTVNIVKNMGIKVYGIGILNAFSEDVGNLIFGKDNYAIIGDIEGTLSILTNKLRKYLQKSV